MSADTNQQQWTDDTVLPVSVIVGSAPGATDPDNWRVLGIVAGARFADQGRQRTRMRSGPEGDLYMWSGFRLRLHSDSIDAYALNIKAEAPAAFVVADFSEDEGLRPLQVTVSLDEAQNLDSTELRDADEQVFRVALPPEVYHWVEHYVVNNYVPRKRKGRGKKRSKALYDAEVGDYAGDDS